MKAGNCGSANPLPPLHEAEGEVMNRAGSSKAALEHLQQLLSHHTWPQSAASSFTCLGTGGSSP